MILSCILMSKFLATLALLFASSICAVCSVVRVVQALVALMIGPIRAFTFAFAPVKFVANFPAFHVGNEVAIFVLRG